jgi:Fe2+ transport system protein B
MLNHSAAAQLLAAPVPSTWKSVVFLTVRAESVDVDWAFESILANPVVSISIVINILYMVVSVTFSSGALNFQMFSEFSKSHEQLPWHHIKISVFAKLYE